jgi:hypothetical protein
VRLKAGERAKGQTSADPAAAARAHSPNNFDIRWTRRYGATRRGGANRMHRRMDGQWNDLRQRLLLQRDRDLQRLDSMQVAMLLRELGDFSLHPQGRPCGPATTRRPPDDRPHACTHGGRRLPGSWHVVLVDWTMSG